MSKLYWQRKRKGLCTHCGKPNNTNTVLCEECRVYVRGLQRERNEYKRRIGQCIYCSEKAIEGSSCCEKHEEYFWNKNASRKYRKYLKTRYDRLKSQGICVTCGKRKADAGVRCTTCAAKYKSYPKERMKMKYQGRVNNGLCPRCGQEAQGDMKICPDCRKKAMEKYYKQKELRKQGGITNGRKQAVHPYGQRVPQTG